MVSHFPFSLEEGVARPRGVGVEPSFWNLHPKECLWGNSTQADPAGRKAQSPFLLGILEGPLSKLSSPILPWEGERERGGGGAIQSALPGRELLHGHSQERLVHLGLLRPQVLRVGLSLGSCMKQS